jgi:uncharacterized protein
MNGEALSATPEAIRRLAVTKQHLAGEIPKKAGRKEILTVVKDLAYVQWDPINIVAPSHVISLWSRIGNFRLSDLEGLMWRDRSVLLHWTPIASIVLTEDYSIYYSLMRRYPGSLSGSWKNHEIRATKFLAQHKGLRKRILSELKKGPRALSQFGDYVTTKRTDGWTSGSDVSLMLFHLHMSGDVLVVGREGNQNVWGLSEKFLPKWAEKKELTVVEFEREASQRAIRALGTAAAREINYYFVRGRYQNLKKTLATLEKESVIRQVNVEGLGKKYERYIHEKDVQLLESMNGDDWHPRTSLIAPFDNLIVGRDRTNRVFGFDYIHEQFFPKEKRKFGTYVLPILWGDRLIGRIDPQLDKKTGSLLINSVHAEGGAPVDGAVAAEIGETIVRFASFLGAKDVVYTSRVPDAWKGSLR